MTPANANATSGHERRDQIIAALLWYGTWCACALIAIGMLLGMREHSVDSMGFGLSGRSLVTAGVALFILLPVGRVALMLAVFLYERDYLYAIISAIVLLIIAAGVVMGL
jgi:hypothetical protein